jgi:hypothetical protein
MENLRNSNLFHNLRLFDAVLEVAAFAKESLERGKKFNDKLPK